MMLFANYSQEDLNAMRHDLLKEGFTDSQIDKFFQVTMSHSTKSDIKPPALSKKKKSTKRDETELQWEKNREFFRQHEKEFKEKYPGLYVAVHDGKVLGTDKELGSLADRLYEEHGNIPVFADIPGNVEEPIVLDLSLTL